MARDTSIPGAVYRYDIDDMLHISGGEEFIVILPDTDIKGVSVVDEFIRSKVLELEIPHEYSSVDKYVSLGMGTASLIPNPDNDQNSLIKTADIALYKAKKMGRNCVCSGD